MSRAQLARRLDRLEKHSAEAQALGAECLALVDQFIAAGGDMAELADVFGLDAEGGRL